MNRHTAAIEQLTIATQTARRSLIDLREAEGERFNARQQTIFDHERAQRDVAAQMRLIERLVASVEALEALDEPADGNGT